MTTMTTTRRTTVTTTRRTTTTAPIRTTTSRTTPAILTTTPASGAGEWYLSVDKMLADELIALWNIYLLMNEGSRKTSPKAMLTKQTLKSVV